MNRMIFLFPARYGYASVRLISLLDFNRAESPIYLSIYPFSDTMVTSFFILAAIIVILEVLVLAIEFIENFKGVRSTCLDSHKEVTAIGKGFANPAQVV
ncbi:hypothetical protein QR680_015266 [Steinernema hermaphroditum]|uniref:Uncharacterized protein n=1 Tax=Steinernema hermaphroditum TaxID=289476 RepID=A0AA39LKA7_9BILA|nr:hypothetical protein QR680_015266 [Steinernema hermaphroditum]